MASRRLAIALALVVLAAAGTGCGDDDETITTAATGASGEESAGDVVADAEAKAAARTAQVALEVHATDNNGSYAGADVAGLTEIDPILADADLTVTSDETTYTVEVVSASGATFSVGRRGGGTVGYTCEPPGTGGCPDNGDWG